MKVRKMGIFNQLFIWLAVLLLMGNVILGYMAYSRSQAALFEQIHAGGGLEEGGLLIHRGSFLMESGVNIIILYI